MSNIVPKKKGLRQIKKANPWDWIHSPGLGLQTKIQTIYGIDMYRIFGDITVFRYSKNLRYKKEIETLGLIASHTTYRTLNQIGLSFKHKSENRCLRQT